MEETLIWYFQLLFYGMLSQSSLYVQGTEQQQAKTKACHDYHYHTQQNTISLMPQASLRFPTTDIINSYFTRKQYECKNVRMQRGIRVKRCSIF